MKGPVRLQEVTILPISIGLPEDRPPLKTFLGMPIYCHDERVGVLCLAEKEDDQIFTDEDESIAAMFAAHAAAIISNARTLSGTAQSGMDWNAFLDVCPLAVSVFDTRRGEITYMNREGLRVVGALGLDNEGLGNVFLDLKFTRPDGRQYSFAELPGTRALQTGETIIAEEVITHRPDGTSFRALVNCVPLFSNSGEIVSVITVSLDMAGAERQELRQAEFLEMVSQELRTPLISIKGSAAALESIVEATQPTETMQLLRIINRQANLMRGQVNNLSELAQIAMGTLPIQHETLDVAGFIQWSCEEYLDDYPAITIQFDIDDELAAVSADRQLTSQVLHNFLRQAAAHAGESSPVAVSAATNDAYVAISVSAEGSFVPSGPASAPANADENTELFRTVSQSHVQAADLESQGEGLAMAFCRSVVEAHGGRIESETDEQKGRLTFTFTLPAVENAEEIPTPASRDIPTGFLPVPVEKPQILVSIEDPKLERVVGSVLLNAGYGAVAASALEEVEELASSRKANLILLDIAGREEESLRNLRRGGYARNLPVIVFCKRDEEEFVARVLENDAHEYMVKPFPPSELLARIESSLQGSNVGGEFAGNRALRVGDLRIGLDDRTVAVAGRPVQLTATEYKLLTTLSDHPGRVLTQDMLLEQVWGPEYCGDSQLLRSYVKSLRQKLGDNARKPTYIFTEHGIGYRMATL